LPGHNHNFGEIRFFNDLPVILYGNGPS
jgi:hypothetical protein